MCNKPQTQPGAPPSTEEMQKEVREFDRDITLADRQLQLAITRSNAAFNASPAGQMQRQFEAYQRIAIPLSESQFIPEAYKKNVGDCVIAVEMAARLGTIPLAIMQNLCIVKGNPTWKSKFLIACVNKCGRYSTLDYRITIEGCVGDVNYKTWEKGKDNKNHEVLKPFERPEIDNLVCVAFATEKITGKVLTSPPVSIRMAVEEGWYMKDGSKWPTMPELMLRYRAASYWVSSFAPEISMGFRTVEEERDVVDTDYVDLSQEQPALAAPKTSANVEEAKAKLRNRDAETAKNAAEKETAGQKPLFDMP